MYGNDELAKEAEFYCKVLVKESERHLTEQYFVQVRCYTLQSYTKDAKIFFR